MNISQQRDAIMINLKTPLAIGRSKEVSVSTPNVSFPNLFHCTVVTVEKWLGEGRGGEGWGGGGLLEFFDSNFKSS